MTLLHIQYYLNEILLNIGGNLLKLHNNIMTQYQLLNIIISQARFRNKNSKRFNICIIQYESISYKFKTNLSNNLNFQLGNSMEMKHSLCNTKYTGAYHRAPTQPSWIRTLCGHHVIVSKERKFRVPLLIVGPITMPTATGDAAKRPDPQAQGTHTTR